MIYSKLITEFSQGHRLIFERVKLHPVTHRKMDEL